MSVKRTLEQVLADFRTRIELLERRPKGIGGGGGTGGLKVAGDPMSGSVVRRTDYGEIRWMPNLAGPVPILYLGLEEGDPYWEYNYAPEGELTNYLPAPIFFDNGTGFYAITAGEYVGDFMADFPINYEIEVFPHFDGQEFNISIRSDGWPYSSVGQFDLTVYNSSQDFSAIVVYGSNDVSGSYSYAYKDDPSIVPGQYFPNPVGNPTYYYQQMDLGPLEWNGWLVEQSKASYENLVTPVQEASKDTNGDWISRPMDTEYWRKVQSLKEQLPFFATGDLAPTVGRFPVKNATTKSRRIGKVVAHLNTVCSGSPVVIDVTIDGVSVFTAPMEIAPGGHETIREPDAFTHGPNGSIGSAPYNRLVGLDSVIWCAGQELGVEIVSVGSGDPGADLQLQVYYG